jgi:DNA-binding NarL/FixJ family response regulator
MAKTLVVSRETDNHSNFKDRLERIGFTNVNVTDADKDGLSFLIRDMKPDIVMMSARFYECSTPYMVGMLHEDFPELYLSVISIGKYPVDRAMYFIVNGAKAYVCSADGIEQFYDGLEAIRNKREFIPPTVQKRIDMRSEYPAPAMRLSKTRIEVLRCICNGFSRDEIADTLAISGRTVDVHRQELHRSLNARNQYDLFVMALELGIVTSDELIFHHSNFTCTPLPEKKRRKRK